MTGAEFERWIKRLGLTKARAAMEMGLNKDTITACCQAAQVKRPYALALMGLATWKSMRPLQEISEYIGEIEVEAPKTNDD